MRKLEVNPAFKPRHEGNKGDLAYGRDLRERFHDNVVHAVKAAKSMGYRQQLHIAEHLFEATAAEANPEQLREISLEVTITGDDGRGSHRTFWQEL